MEKMSKCDLPRLRTVIRWFCLCSLTSWPWHPPVKAAGRPAESGQRRPHSGQPIAHGSLAAAGQVPGGPEEAAPGVQPQPPVPEPDPQGRGPAVVGQRRPWPGGRPPPRCSPRASPACVGVWIASRVPLVGVDRPARPPHVRGTRSRGASSCSRPSSLVS